MDELDDDDDEVLPQEVVEFLENADGRLTIAVNDDKLLVLHSFEDPYEALRVIMSAYEWLCERYGIEEDDMSDTRTIN